MGRGTYISENLNRQQIDFMLLLDDFELEIFTLRELRDKFGDKFVNIGGIVENLCDKRILARIERGKYCRANFYDEKVIGCFMADNGAVAYWSALNIHGLTDQFPNSMFIQTGKPKKSKSVFGIKYKFVTVAPAKITGILIQGAGNRKYRITDPEKTIVDCFDLHKYSGGYAELIHAFSHMRLSSSKMIKYCKAAGNIAAMKRMGFLAELLGRKNLGRFIEFARSEKNEAYNPFDPSGPDTGEFISEWKLRLNISRERILEICDNY